MMFNLNKLPFHFIPLISILLSCGKGTQSNEDIKKVEEFASEEIIDGSGKCQSQDLGAPKIPAMSCTDTTIQRELIRYSDSINNFGGIIEDTHHYELTEESFNKFLENSNIRYFKANEFIRPGHPRYAKSCGITDLIPPKSCWYRTVTLLLLADKIRESIGRPIFASSLYRSKCYNSKIGGAKKSDHLLSTAIDLSFNNNDEIRERVENYIYNNMWVNDLLGISDEIKMDNGQSNIALGLGKNLIHISLNSPHGRRFWPYSDYIPNDKYPNRCWK